MLMALPELDIGFRFFMLLQNVRALQQRFLGCKSINRSRSDHEVAHSGWRGQISKTAASKRKQLQVSP